MSGFVVSVEELGFGQRVDELVEKVLWVFLPLLGRLEKMMYIFWISYCSCMLTVILKLSIQMRSVSRALANLDCVAFKTRPLRQELSSSWLPVGYRKKLKYLF